MPKQSVSAGQLLYFAYQREANARVTVAVQRYDQLPGVFRDAWDAFATAIDFEPSDELKAAYAKRTGP